MHGFSSVIESPTEATNLGISTEHLLNSESLVFVDLDFGELEPEQGSLFREVTAGDYKFFNVVPFMFTGDKGQCRCIVLGQNIKPSEVPNYYPTVETPPVELPEHVSNDSDDEMIPAAVWLVISAIAFLFYLVNIQNA